MVGRHVHDGGAELPAGDALPGACTVHDGLQRLVQLLPRVMRGLRRTRAGLGSGTDKLGPRHRSALALIQDDPVTVGALAGALGLTLPTASGLVADLEDAGFVDRSPDPADRRRTLVTVVGARRGCVARWLEGSSAPIARVLEQLTPQERSAFVKGMAYLDAALAEATTAPAAGPTTVSPPGGGR